MDQTCRDCNESKPWGDFYRSKKHTSGRDTLCKDCAKARISPERYEKRKEYWRAYGQAKYWAEHPGLQLVPWQLVVDGKKICKSCQESKPVDDFWKDPHTSSGRFRDCKVCARPKKKAYEQKRKQDPDYAAKRKEYAREWATIQRRKRGVEPRTLKTGAYAYGRKENARIPIPQELREAVLQFVQRQDEGWGTVAIRAGYVKDNRVDTTAPQRKLGLKPDSGKYQETATVEVLGRIAQSIYREPAEFGI
jgi:hypothetical protein